MSTVHKMKYDLLKDNLNNSINFLDSYESILTSLEEAPLSNEIEQSIENIKERIKESKNNIANLKQKIKDIDELKSSFDDSLELPCTGINSKYRTEDLLLSVPVFDDKKENIPRCILVTA